MFERGDRFLFLFALANAGGVVAYVPFLTLLLPAKVAGLAGGAQVEWLGLATLIGAIAASLSNVAFGWASDLVATRRLWATAGLGFTVVSYVLLHAARTPLEVIAAVAVYQVALNMLLSPLAAWAADAVPDRRKGVLGGLLGAGPLVGATAGVMATLPVFSEVWMRMAAISGLVLLLTAPLLLLRAPAYPDGPVSDGAAQRMATARADFALIWLSRLLVQVAGNVMFGFLFYYFQSLPEAPPQAGIARLIALALFLSFPIALAFGGLSDRLGRRKPFLVVAAAAAGVGLGMMASSTDLLPSTLGYTLFGCGSAVFLALHSSYAMQLLPSPARRGRDLGLLNLANTLPAIVAPLLAIWLVPGRGFAPLLNLLAGLMVLAGFCILFVKRDAQAA
jgi:MFS family permease